MKKILSLCLITYLYYTFLNNSYIIKENIILSCNLFIKNIFPSLFPILVISSIICNTNLLDNISFFINPIIKKLFNINNILSNIFIISLFTGSPGNAKIIKELYDKKLLTVDDCNKIILYTHFSNPLFIISFVKYKTKLVLFSHYISNIIIGIILKNIKSTKDDKIQYAKNNSMTNIIFSSINSSMSTLLFILGTIATFYIITSITNIEFFKLILELTQGMNHIYNLNITTKIKTILFGSLLSFGGFCKHFQVYGILKDININYIKYLLMRIIQSIITALIIFILY